MIAPESPESNQATLKKPHAMLSDMDVDVQFLLAEFEGLRELRAQDESIADKRSDTLLTLISALAAGLAILSQTAIDKRNFLYLSLFVASSLALISINTYFKTIRLDILSTNYIRAINRIRAYFAEHAVTNIKEYLLLPTDHFFPKYGAVSRSRETLMIIDSILVSAIAGITYLLLENITNINFLFFLIATISFAIAALVQIVITSSLFAQAERRARAYQGDIESVEIGARKQAAK